MHFGVVCSESSSTKASPLFRGRILVFGYPGAWMVPARTLLVTVRTTWLFSMLSILPYTVLVSPFSSVRSIWRSCVRFLNSGSRVLLRFWFMKRGVGFLNAELSSFNASVWNLIRWFLKTEVFAVCVVRLAGCALRAVFNSMNVWPEVSALCRGVAPISNPKQSQIWMNVSFMVLLLGLLSFLWVQERSSCTNYAGFAGVFIKLLGLYFSPVMCLRVSAHGGPTESQRIDMRVGWDG